MLSSYRAFDRDKAEETNVLPVQVKPLPVNPLLQVQNKLPDVLLQVANSLHIHLHQRLHRHLFSSNTGVARIFSAGVHFS